MSNKVPAYRLHKQSGQAVVTLTDPAGRRKDVLLGKYKTATNRAEYARVIQEWEAGGRRLAQRSTAADLSVNEVMVAYFAWAQDYYRKDGEQTTQVERIRSALRPLKELYGHTAVKDFGPLALKALQLK